MYIEANRKNLVAADVSAEGVKATTRKYTYTRYRNVPLKFNLIFLELGHVLSEA